MAASPVAQVHTGYGAQDTAPVAHEHEGVGAHSHEGGDQPHSHEAPVQQGYVPDPAVQAFVTSISLSVAHDNVVGPYEVVKNVTAALEGLGYRGVVVGISSVELRGDGALIGL